MSTLKVNTIEASTGSEVDINATLGSIPSLVVTGVSTFSSPISFGSTANIRIGDSTTGCSLTSGTHNFFAGASAGRSTTTGSNNNFLGQCAGFSNTTGVYNNFFGAYAGLGNTSGSRNVFIGLSAGQCNTTGNHNVFLGNTSGRNNTSGSCNIFLGFDAGRLNATGCHNFFVGQSAGRYNTTGQFNNFFGRYAGYCNTTGVYNNFFGRNAGYGNTSGSHNNFMGYLAGRYNSIGCNNNFFGFQSARCNTTGSFNNFLGYYAGFNNTTGSNNNFLGRAVGYANTTGAHNNFLGFYSGLCNTVGTYNNFFGCNAGCGNTTGVSNNFFGVNAGKNNSSGSQNNIIGNSAGQSNSTGSDNNFFGRVAGYNNTTGSCNTFLGRYAGCSNTTGSHNVAIGNNAQLPSATGSCQLAIGSAGVNWIYGDSSARVLFGTSTSALEKVVIKGDGGGLQINRNDSGSPTSGQALGSIGFKGIVSANSNAAAEVLIQAVAEENHSGLTAGSRLEFYTKPNGTGPGSAPTEQMRISNAGVITFDQARFDAGGGLWFTPSTFNRVVQRCKTSTTGSAGLVEFINPNGLVGSIVVSGSATAYNTSSDYRLKENVTPVTDGITRLQQLKPSRFNFIADPDKTVDGFLAHEVQDIVPEAITGEKDAVDADGNPIYQGIDQSKLVPLLTAALQEAIAKIETLEAKVAALESA